MKALARYIVVALYPYCIELPAWAQTEGDEE